MRSAVFMKYHTEVTFLQGFKLASWPLEVSRAPALQPRVGLRSSLEWSWAPQGSSVQINPFLPLFLCLAKGSGPSDQTLAPGLADAINLCSLGTPETQA